ncbi:DUF3341 domain-containing protein [Sediminitomix flava]|uniref:Quinol:cytochrome c oxidoreductase membrane protein n=1 Tax=Sediminitomix flava TaxID=379075 RepID=A0A315ZE59_SEDFL|nr:DUF3341 domain-containing protein [Sediminitomix flava]PWJ43108.1 quinol:cytochrome c oxidoreductase membrane protein [Sediminitomix flava]
MEKNKHFLVGIFDDHDILLNAVKHVRKQGVKIEEVYTPYPVHFLEDALGYKRSFMPKAAFGFGALGTSLAIFFQTWVMGIDWPMIIGGKTHVAIPDFVPITFELTVLLSAFGMVGTFFGTQDLKPHKVPRVFDRRQSDDKHVMAIDLAANSLSEEELTALLKDVQAEEVNRKDFTDKENKGSFIEYVVDLFTNGVTESARSLNK